MDGTIIKALSGFYYVDSGSSVYECRARGKFRLDGTSPMVGDRVSFDADGSKGYVTAVHERKNFFIRPTVANIDALIFIAANTNPVTDPFLIDRVSVITEEAGCELIVCINKTDIDPADELFALYSSSGFETYRVSAVTGEGLEQLGDAIDILFAGQVPCDGSILTNPRQYDACRRSYEALLRALQGLKLGQTPDAVLIDIEEAMEAIGEVTGATVREDITARIFERFCVGK